MYTYDADGRRVSKVKDGISERYIWDGDQLAVTIAPGADPFFTITLSDTGIEYGVEVPLVVGKTYYVKIGNEVYSAAATHHTGQADLFRGRWDDTEIPVDPPDPEEPETFTELKVGGVWISISDDTGTGFVTGPAEETIELYTGDPAATTPTVSYVRGLSLVAAVQDGVRTYYHYNAHGDVVQLTNSSGTVTKNYTYDAFGVEKNAATSDANPFRYCGEQFDSETGNYYLRARYYSPGVGRFTQEDTHWNPGNMIYGDEPRKWNELQGEEDTLNLHAYTYKPEATAVAQAGNLYAYAAGNPVYWSDSTGQAVWGKGVSGSAAFGFGGSVGGMMVWDDEGNSAIITTGYYGGGTPNAGFSGIRMVSSASNIFEYANGFTGVAGGSILFFSAEGFMGVETDGSSFGGATFGAGLSVLPVELHAGVSYTLIGTILTYQGEPVPTGVTVDYFYTLNKTLKTKAKNDMGLPDGYRSNVNRSREERLRDAT